jgi:hypothetical protein
MQNGPPQADTVPRWETRVDLRGIAKETNSAVGISF